MSSGTQVNDCPHLAQKKQIQLFQTIPIVADLLIWSLSNKQQSKALESISL